MFAIPYEEAFTLIGTTDVEHHTDPTVVKIDAAEVRYLCDTVNRYFTKKTAPSDVVWSYSGVRPLLDDKAGDPSSVTRDYKLEFEDAAAPLLSVFGGKITTYRKLAESAVDELSHALDERAPLKRWTKDSLLPGGDLTAAAVSRASCGTWNAAIPGCLRHSASVTRAPMERGSPTSSGTHRPSRTSGPKSCRNSTNARSLICNVKSGH